MSSISIESLHPTAQISPGAKISADVTIGPYCVIGDRVQIGSGTVVGPYTLIEGPTSIGRKNRFFGYGAIGTDPQDLKYRGEESWLHIGDENLIREFVTLNRGTRGGGGETRVGNRNLLMTGTHVAHDCVVLDNVILANSATLAGHVTVESGATVGAFSGVHQYCRVGQHAFIGGYSVITKDALPYIKTVGSRREAETFGINRVGLERKGFSGEQIKRLKSAYLILFRKDLKIQEAIQQIRQEGEVDQHVEVLLRFIESSERGFIR